MDSLNPSSPDGDDEEFFSFEENGAEAYLTWDGTNGSMTGTMWQNSGGLNALFTLSFTFGGEVANGMGFTATSGSGTPTRIGGDGQVINLGFEQDSIGRAFLFLFDGHRLPGDNSSPVGRGWVTANGRGGNYNDFLFTAAPVPLPAAAWLFISGLLGFGFWKRRKTVAA